MAVAAVVPVDRAAFAVTLPTLATSHSGIVYFDVSCTSATSCTAVGAYGHAPSLRDVGSNYEPLYATESGGVWGRATVFPGWSNGALFTSVSCSTAKDCTAVGYDYSGQFDVHGAEYVGYPIAATESNGTWGAATELTSAGAGVTLLSVSCLAAVACTAVGGSIGGDDAAYPESITQSAGAWGSPTAIKNVGLGNLAGISCTALGDCTAVGTDMQCDCGFGILFANQPIYAAETAGTWGVATELPPPGGTGSGFNGVSCTAAASCTAVGADADGRPFFATESAGTWGAATDVTAPGKYGSFSGVSCTATTECTAVGASFTSGSVELESIHMTETAGTWGAAKVAGGGSFNGVSCAAAAACATVGSVEICGCRGPSSFPIYAVERAGVWPTAPSAPRIGKVIPGSRSIRVSWVAPTSSGGAPITGYTATVISSLKGVIRAYACASTGSSCTVTGLTNGRTYSVRVFARNPVGSSAGSASKR